MSAIIVAFNKKIAEEITAKLATNRVIDAARMSPQQRAIVEWAMVGMGSAFVEAVAGAGKTTTLLAASRTMGDCSAGTFHSAGLRAWKKLYPKVLVDQWEKRDRMMLVNDIPTNYATIVQKLVSHAKQRGLAPQTGEDVPEPVARDEWQDIIDHHDLAADFRGNEDEVERQVSMACGFAQKCLEWSLEQAPLIVDFDDMLWLPLVVESCKMWKHDWVLIDEAQDTNPARRMLVHKMLKPNGRAIFVGDPAQAIYGFTGADANAVEKIISEFNCTRLPLTITYRCPKSVVAQVHAETRITAIQAAETAPEGQVVNIWDNELGQIGKQGAKIGDTFLDVLSSSDAILCRNNRPIVAMAYDLIRRGIPCHVEGRDIGLGLIKLVNRFDVRDLDQLLSRLDAYIERECEKLQKAKKNMAAESMSDRGATIHVIAEGCKTVDELRQRITDLFMDSEKEKRPTLTLSTIHKAKGREWSRVFVLGPNTLMPSIWARQEWELEQEDNLRYVAYTRSMGTLVLVNMETDK